MYRFSLQVQKQLGLPIRNLGIVKCSAVGSFSQQNSELPEDISNTISLDEKFYREHKARENPHNHLVRWITQTKNSELAASLSNIKTKTDEFGDPTNRVFRCTIIDESKQIEVYASSKKKIDARKIALLKLLERLKSDYQYLDLVENLKAPKSSNQNLELSGDLEETLALDEQFYKDHEGNSNPLSHLSEWIAKTKNPDLLESFRNIQIETDVLNEPPHSVFKCTITEESKEIKVSALSRRKNEAKNTALLKLLEEFKSEYPILMDKEPAIGGNKAFDLLLGSHEVDQASKLLQKFHDVKIQVDTFLSKSYPEPDGDDVSLCAMTGFSLDDLNAQLEFGMHTEKRNLELLLQLNRKQLPQDLPVNLQGAEILDAIKKHNIVLIIGATGSGKSTQVPQMIFDQWCRDLQGAECNIVVTEPRRVTVLDMVNRVSAERQCNIGDSVGYRMHLNKEMLNELGGIVFYTAGCLNQILRSPNTLEHVKYLVIDEVHDPSMENQILLASVKLLLEEYPDLKIILMSAAIDPERIVKYYDIPEEAVINVQGRPFPLIKFYVPEVYEELGLPYTSSDLCVKEDFRKIVKVVVGLDETKPPGTILVFVSGWSAIRSLQNSLTSSIHKDRFQVMWAHSRMSEEDLAQFYDKTPHNKRKVIIATNVCETGITIPDVTYVVDVGVEKGFSFTSDVEVSRFHFQNISKASAEQRAGRAGRTHVGEVYRLYTEEQFNEFEAEKGNSSSSTMFENDLCKTLNQKKIPLETQIKALPFGVDGNLLKNLTQTLPKIGLLKIIDGGGEELTPVGKFACNIQDVHIVKGKAILLSALFGCCGVMMESVVLPDSPMFLFKVPISDMEYYSLKVQQEIENDVLSALSLVTQLKENPRERDRLHDATLWTLENVPPNIGRTLSMNFPSYFQKVFGNFEKSKIHMTVSFSMWRAAMASIATHYVTNVSSTGKPKFYTVSEDPRRVHLLGNSLLNISEKKDSLISCRPIVMENKEGKGLLVATDCVLVDPLAAALFSGSNLIQKPNGELHIPDLNLSFSLENKEVGDLILDLRKTFDYCLNSIVLLAERKQEGMVPYQLALYTKSLVNLIENMLAPDKLGSSNLKSLVDSFFSS